MNGMVLRHRDKVTFHSAYYLEWMLCVGLHRIPERSPVRTQSEGRLSWLRFLLFY
jgi:hypothetical protein